MPAPRVRRATFTGPASANLHNSDMTQLTSQTNAANCGRARSMHNYSNLCVLADYYGLVVLAVF